MINIISYHDNEDDHDNSDILLRYTRKIKSVCTNVLWYPWHVCYGATLSRRHNRKREDIFIFVMFYCINLCLWPIDYRSIITITEVTSLISWIMTSLIDRFDDRLGVPVIGIAGHCFICFRIKKIIIMFLSNAKCKYNQWTNFI